MAAALRISGPGPGPGPGPKQTCTPIARPAFSCPPMKAAGCQLKQKQQSIYASKGGTERRQTFQSPRLRLAVQTRSYSNSGLTSPSPSETVQQFYTCINDKNLKQLAELVSDDCHFNDLSFPQPFRGKKDVIRFYERLTSVMGKNVKFRVGRVCEGDGLTAATDWHLEWQGKQVPFSRGCSFYECEEQGKSLIIKDARTVTESPIKPGFLLLVLLKMVTTLFDDFPKATERFLKSPDAIPKTLLKIYSTILRPFISPLVASYINLWKLLARLLGFAFSIILYILKIFIK